MGMSTETIDRMFDPFFTTKGIGHGTGLGLSAVHGTLEVHHGSISVESELGEGSTFRCFLPVAHDDAPAQTSTHHETPTSGTGCILLVDDEEMVRKVGQRMLTNLGYTVLAASSGAEGIQTMMDRGHEIDLLVIDAQMPHMSGAETIRQIRNDHPDLPVVMASGYDVEASGALPEDIQGFVQKPYTMVELSRGVAAAMASSKLIQK
jgi:CheY-like chemotaxis protein